MDRGVKIAIFVASIMSLGLGLIWDQVLSHARVAVEESADDELAGEIVSARMGSSDIERMEVSEGIDPGFDIKPIANEPDAAEPEAAALETAWTDYVVREGDSYWKIAHVTFKDRGLSSNDIETANPGKVLRPGTKVRIPPNKAALKTGAPAKSTTSSQAPKPTPGSTTGETTYVVKEGDSWWKIAHKAFKGRNLSTSDLEAANPGVKLVAGKTVKIPKGK